jgi:predicted helicase
MALSVIANADRIRQIKTFPSLVKYLRDELSWPIEADDFEDLTYDWEPEELGIDKASAAKIKEVKQLRPLADGQPWGVFFVNFEPKQLPVVALRRLLNSMVIRKRESANKSERQAWAMNDLMFISSYGDSGERHISFAHFSQPEGKNDLPILKVLGWDNSNAPLRLDWVATKLTECLAWPDDEKDIDGWRDTWQSAFSLRHRETITTAKDLAIRLAALARAIRDRIATTLAIETDKGPLTKLMKAFQSALMHDLDEKGFADMYAQTIAYGLLSARIADPSSRTADDLTAHMKTNPFLKELMQTFLHVGGRTGKAGGPGIDFDELGVSEVVELLDDANIEAVIRDFGDKKRDEDPVMHFYESFLHEYNKQLKIQRGVFYTPQPVVSYIVRSVHELLQSEFGLADGLADTTTWGEMLKKHLGLRLPPLTDEPGEKRTISPDEPFVQILDPATGTATFLVEVIDVIHATLKAKWKKQRMTEAQQIKTWNDYVPKHLLPRLHAYELMMAPYAIAHMKISLKLAETGYDFGSEARARIYLTNALEPWHRQMQLPELDALAHEAAAVNEIKRSKHFTVVIGNPPYSNLSSNLTTDARALVEPFKFINGERIHERGALSLEKNLNDDYVKFVRLSQMTIHNVGVSALITNSGFMGNPTLRGMRWSLLQSYSRFFIFNLAGYAGASTRAVGDTKDENVFDIANAGVAIHIGVSAPFRSNRTVHYSEIMGAREKKYSFLTGNSVATTDFVPVDPLHPFFLLEPADEVTKLEYELGIPLLSLFQVNSTGIRTLRDAFVVSLDREPLLERIKRFRDSKASDVDLCAELNLEMPGWWKVPESRKSIARVSDLSKHVSQVSYRPFDLRTIFYHDSLVGSPRRPVMQHMEPRGENLALHICRQLSSPSWEHVLVTRGLTDDCYVSNRTKERGYTLPLYLRADSEQLVLDDGALNCDLVPIQTALETKDASIVNGETFFCYIYATLFSPTFRTRYVDFLKRDFPRVPMTNNLSLFRSLAAIGGELVALHLLESPQLDRSITELIGHHDLEVESISWSKDTVWLDRDQSSGFQGVHEDVWNFRIGSYKVCEKWLKDRKGRTLSKDDIAHYQKIVVALSETIYLMAEIDKVIDKHGGWPGAFQSGKAS